jgi:hypothetical protein
MHTLNPQAIRARKAQIEARREQVTFQLSKEMLRSLTIEQEEEVAAGGFFSRLTGALKPKPKVDIFNEMTMKLSASTQGREDSLAMVARRMALAGASAPNAAPAAATSAEATGAHATFAKP